MLEYLVKGIVLGFGFLLGKSCIRVLAKRIARRYANDDAFMEREMERDPESYKLLLRYRTKKQ